MRDFSDPDYYGHSDNKTSIRSLIIVNACCAQTFFSGWKKERKRRIKKNKGKASNQTFIISKSKENSYIVSPKNEVYPKQEFYLSKRPERKLIKDILFTVEGLKSNGLFHHWDWSFAHNIFTFLTSRPLTCSIIIPAMLWLTSPLHPGR